MRPHSILLVTALAFVVALVAADAEQYLPLTGSLNRGATAAESGNLAASAFGKQLAEGATQAAQTAQIAQGQKAAASAAAAREAEAFGKSAYDQRIAQALVGVLNYCEGYICTEWLDEFGAAYTNAGAAAQQAAEGYGEQAAFANQATAAERAAYAAQQQAALGEQRQSAAGALKGAEAYGVGAAGSELGFGTGIGGTIGQVPWGGYSYGPAYGGLSGSQAAQLGLNSNAAQYGSLYGEEAAGVKAKEAAGQEASALEAAAAQAKAAQAQAAAAKQTAFTVEQLSRLKNYGRKCRRYQCYHKYWDGQVYSYGPNYYVANGQLVNEQAAQAAQQAAFGDQAAAAKEAAFAAEAGAAKQFGAGAAGATANDFAAGYAYPGYW